MPTARTGDLSTAWFEIGRGSPIVLIHGLADDHRLWRKVVPSLAIRHRMLLYDLRGHGQTSLGDADGSLQQLGQDLLNLLDALELETAALTGYSLGGTVAMRLAIDHPERLDPELARITTPTLVVSADLDQHCPPRAGEIIAQAIPGASLEIITGSGHPIPLEQPDQLAGLIESYLRESLPA